MIQQERMQYHRSASVSLSSPPSPLCVGNVKNWTHRSMLWIVPLSTQSHRSTHKTSVFPSSPWLTSELWWAVWLLWLISSCEECQRNTLVIGEKFREAKISHVSGLSADTHTRLQSRCTSGWQLGWKTTQNMMWLISLSPASSLQLVTVAGPITQRIPASFLFLFRPSLQ